MFLKKKFCPFSCSLGRDPCSRCCFVGHLDFARCHCDHCFLPLWPPRTMEAFTFLSSASELLDSEQESVTSAKTIFRLRMVLKIHSRVWVECKRNKNICLKNYWEMSPCVWSIGLWALLSGASDRKADMQKEICPMKAPVLSLTGLCKILVFACEKMVKLCRFVTRFCQCELNWL